ncbi:MAG: hypothetical protein U5K71_12235 [Gracilimonas sp.]|nr:hypothetical protein [Gracilimonas sp.]
MISDGIKKLREAGYWVEDENYRGSHLFGIRVGENHNIEAIKKSFDKENILVSFRGDSIRVSPNVYNTQEDFDKLVQVLTA